MIMSNKNFPVPLILNENCPNPNPLVNPICYYNADSKDIECICDTSNIGNSYPLLTFGSSNLFSLVLLTSNILNNYNIPKCSLVNTGDDNISCNIIANVAKSQNQYLSNSSPSGLKVLSSNICITSANTSANTWKLVTDNNCSDTAFLNSFLVSYNPSPPSIKNMKPKIGGLNNGSTTPKKYMPQ